MKVAIVGASGLIGHKMLEVLEEKNFAIDELILCASRASVGKEIRFRGRQHHLVSVEDAIASRPDIAIFSAGSEASLLYAPTFAKQGCYVIDNSSAWRMKKEIPLVVPEINADTITADTKIIANPNCSTIQMVVALAPLHDKFGIRRIVVSTYQSVSGSGMRGIQQLECEEKGESSEHPIYPHQIYRNVIPHGGTFNDDGYTTEEQKLVDETRKILRAPQIAVSATVARVPVTGGHSESVNVEFDNEFTLDEVQQLLANTNGVVLCDDPHHNIYPTAITAYNKNEVFVGRLRRDSSIKNGLNLWIVSDNTRKGAATNAVQIAEYITKNIIKK